MFHPTPIVKGMKCLHLPLRACDKLLLLVAWVWLVLLSTASSGGMPPLEIWCQATVAHLKTTPRLDCSLFRMVWQDHRKCLGLDGADEDFFMEWGLTRKTSTIDSCPVVTVPIDPQGSPCWLPTTAVFAWSGDRGGRIWQWPIGSMSSWVMSPNSNFTW